MKKYKLYLRFWDTEGNTHLVVAVVYPFRKKIKFNYNMPHCEEVDYLEVLSHDIDFYVPSIFFEDGLTVREAIYQVQDEMAAAMKQTGDVLEAFKGLQNSQFLPL